MGKRCAVPGCISGSSNEVKRRKLYNEKQVVLFGVPESRASEWTTAIGITTPLTKNHVVCQFHFKDGDIMSHFVNAMPNGTLNYMERVRWTLRKDALPVAGTIPEKLQPAKFVNVINSAIAKTSEPSSQPQIENVNVINSAVAETSERSSQPRIENVNVIHSAVAETSERSSQPRIENVNVINSAVAETSERSSQPRIENINAINPALVETTESSPQPQIENLKKCSGANTCDSQDYYSRAQSRDNCDESSIVDCADGGSDEKIREDTSEYSIEKLITDLAESQWRRRWAWNRNDNEIVFVYLKSITLEARIYFSVNNDLTMTVSLADRKKQIQLNDKIRAFPDLLAMLIALENMRECVGTGRAEETRSRTCSIFVEEHETYMRCRSFERCIDCRDLRQRLACRANRPKITDADKHSRVKTELRLLRKRHATLQQKVCHLKQKIVEVRNESRKRKTSVARETVASLSPEQQPIEMYTMSVKAKKAQGNSNKPLVSNKTLHKRFLRT